MKQQLSLSALKKAERPCHRESVAGGDEAMTQRLMDTD
jgi:hypothetical protein